MAPTRKVGKHAQKQKEKGPTSWKHFLKKGKSSKCNTIPEIRKIKFKKKKNTIGKTQKYKTEAKPLEKAQNCSVLRTPAGLGLGKERERPSQHPPFDPE